MSATPLSLPMAMPVPVLPEGIEYRHCSVEDLLSWCIQHKGREWMGCDLVLADPAWKYSNTGTNGAVGKRYPVMSTAAIVDDMALAGSACLGRPTYLGVWVTPPFEEEWFEAIAKVKAKGQFWPWRYLSGGSWFKPGLGAGFHWRGDQEGIKLYELEGAKPKKTKSPLSNSCYDERTEHSEKPIGWQAEMLAHWTEPGGQVLSLYSGRATVERACLATGRRCLGAEIDEDRWNEGMGLIAGRVGVGFHQRRDGGAS